ncbi:hypothetical protein ABZ413_17220 [Nocardia rhamnosiphila]|uniref:hypothetical protein n=1 Tax=Nocardia rhamnosiphila TaxID=426716 RepID=UPI0033CE38E6
MGSRRNFGSDLSRSQQSVYEIVSRQAKGGNQQQAPLEDVPTEWPVEDLIDHESRPLPGLDTIIAKADVLYCSACGHDLEHVCTHCRRENQAN